ncbi:MAG: 16S rRNA (guanine(966)-N(2))-methyltransferase RsmD [Acidimicrobiia bacterium]|nr:16S rRNA (guanine(966)-N(2))-methyltransferase RsmD [Acidimicrobiia bacterium]
MRVIAGIHRGRKLQAPDTSDTRPVMDRVKESLFSSIAAEVPGAAVLDLYAGAGSFGIEALSRGAESAVFVESGRAALMALRANLETLRLEADVFAGPAERFVQEDTRRFDLVFCDPPWPLDSGSVSMVLSHLVPRLDADTTVVVTRRTGDEAPEPHGLRIDDVRAHGDTTIIRYVMDQ